MSIEKQIAELLEESAKLKTLEYTTEEVVLEDEVVEEAEQVVEESVEEIEPLEEMFGIGGIKPLGTRDRFHADVKQYSKFTTDQKIKHHQNVADRINDNLEGFNTNRKGVVPVTPNHVQAAYMQASKTGAKEHKPEAGTGYGDLLKDLNNLHNNVKSAVRTGGADRHEYMPKLDAPRVPLNVPLTKKDGSNGVQEDVDALLYGEDLTEEFKVKAATIFEAAVMTRVKAETHTLAEAFDARLDEEAELAKEEIIEKVDGYLNFIVEQWMSDNEIAIEKGLKTDILEGFVDGLKTLFQENYIEVPEERFDVVGDLQEQVNFLESKLDESLEQNVSMSKQINEMTRDSVTDSFCESMTDTEVEKFKSLAEELSYDSEEVYTSKLQVIKENYFNRKPSGNVDSVVTDSPVQLNEQTYTNIDANVAKYLETFNRIK